MEDKIFKGLGEFIEKSEVLLEMTNKKSYGGLSISEVHCIERIEKLEKANVTSIAREMKMTRGGITKITRKLLEKGFIEKYSLEDNKKEIYFSLTSEGRRVYDKHEILHEEVREREERFFRENFSEKEKSVIADFLEKLNRYTEKLIDEMN